MEDNTVSRGDIFYISKGADRDGSVTEAGRPGVIISNDINNKFSPVVEVVFLTTKEKRHLPTHVEISSAPQLSTAMCEQVMTISKNRLENYCGRCTEHEMKNIDRAVMVSLGINDDKR